MDNKLPERRPLSPDQRARAEKNKKAASAIRDRRQAEAAGDTNTSTTTTSKKQKLAPSTEAAPRVKEWIYVLKLEHDCFYVGRTKKPPGVRIEEHRTGKGSAWTRLHKVVGFHVPPRPVEGLHIGLQEDMETKKQMKIHGIEFVRGGAYTRLDLPDSEIDLLKKELFHDVGNCTRCGWPGHFVATCNANTKIDGTAIYKAGMVSDQGPTQAGPTQAGLSRPAALAPQQSDEEIARSLQEQERLQNQAWLANVARADAALARSIHEGWRGGTPTAGGDGWRNIPRQAPIEAADREVSRARAAQAQRWARERQQTRERPPQPRPQPSRAQGYASSSVRFYSRGSDSSGSKDGDSDSDNDSDSFDYEEDALGEGEEYWDGPDEF